MVGHSLESASGLQAKTRTENRMERTGSSSVRDSDCATSDSVSSFAGSVSALQWVPGVELPPLSETNASFVLFCQSVLDCTATIFPAIKLSDAVVILVYRLIISRRALTRSGMGDLYVVLASLFHRRIAVQDAARARKLQVRLERRPGSGGVSGLDVTLRYQVGQRKRDPVLQHMSYDEAEEYLLRQWDLVPFDFDFGPSACGDQSGGPGGDPSGDRPSADPSGDGDGGKQPEECSTAVVWMLDIRTRTLEACLQMRAVCASAERQRRGLSLASQWHQENGVLPENALRVIDKYVRGSKLVQARREETYELQLIKAKQQIDQLRSEKAALEATCRAAELEALRAVRLREDASSRAAAKEATAKAMASRAEQEHGRELRERLRAANANFLERKKELEMERMLAEERVTIVQIENTRLERQLNRTRAALSVKGRDNAQAIAEVEAEVERLREGRIWSRVKEEETRRIRAEEESSRLLAEVERLMREANSRSLQHAAEKQELKYLRHRVKDLQAAVASYQVKSNRKFFEVEPFVEDNVMLRAKLEAQVCYECCR